ncbi:MAG: hypothetical protein HYW05_02810 [Candidatus Diapherotrites archaeon]|nr:hypothetical protein [Candidatus Diapherotrites archaeon]
MKGIYNIKNAAIAGGAIVAILYIICVAAFAFVPEQALGLARVWFHGIQLLPASVISIGPVTFVKGLIASAVAGAVIGIVFAAVCKYVCCREK